MNSFKALRKGNYQVSILILSLISYLTALLFSFEIIVTSFYFWLFGALIIVGANKNNQNETNYTVFNLRLSKFIQRLLILSLLLIFCLFTYLQLQKIISNHYFLASKRAGARGAYNEALLLYNYSKATGYSHKQYDLYFADSISYLLIENNQKPYRELELKLEEIANSLSLENYDHIFTRARIKSALGNYNEAKEDYKKAINFAPGVLKTYTALADNYFLQEDFDGALKYYDIAIEKTPDINNERINDEHRSQLKKHLSAIWEKKGDVYYKQGGYDMLLQFLRKHITIICTEFQF
jgi:tetratricopeptide (TPR) repeat protein